MENVRQEKKRRRMKKNNNRGEKEECNENEEKKKRNIFQRNWKTNKEYYILQFKVCLKRELSV